MKFLFYFSLLLIVLPYSYSSGQTADEILNNELAFSCHLFTRLDIPDSTDEIGKISPERIPLSDETGFIYLNIPENLVVIHQKLSGLGSKIAERFQIIAIKQKNPIILSTVTEDLEEVFIHIIPRSGTIVQFYYPETKINYGDREQIMAFEMLELKPLGNTIRFVE